MKHYDVERTGQMDFFDNYGIDYVNEPILIDNTDGIYKGHILEFKLSISNLSKVLLQAIKYLSAMRIRGESVPATILLIDLNHATVYQFSSKDYLKQIEQVYVGSASKSDEDFADTVDPDKIYHYEQMLDSSDLKKELKLKPEKDWYMPVHLDENDIVGWANRYYRELPSATKGDFLGDDSGKVKIVGEIREPKQFKDLIYPYQEKTNERFRYLMDCLNDRLHRKDLGAFYTPELYARKAAELVAEAVAKVPAGNDYIILDRCAGSGNLEQALSGLKDRNGEELLSHAVVSTVEYYEYKVLLERLGDKVRDIIPPTEENIKYQNGMIANADAMSEEYVNNPIIQKYVSDPKCSVILFENPPYRDVTTSTTHTGRHKSDYISEQMKQADDVKGAAINDLANRFIWSGFHYFLRQPTDSYIIFSPVKYFKQYNFVNAEFETGYLFNRKFFHATPAAISCIWWQNQQPKDKQTEFPLTAFNISNNELKKEKNITIKKVHSLFSQKLYDKRLFNSDKFDGIVCNFNGTERLSEKTVRIKKTYNSNILGYIRASSYSLQPMSRQLLRCGEYDGNGFFLRSDNYLDKLPLWVAKQYPIVHWYERDSLSTTADGGTAYTQDTAFLQHCLLYTCLSNQNKCLSFTGSDGRYYRNELCLDTTNGATQASSDLNSDKFTAQEKKLYNLWSDIISAAKKTKNYNPKLTYGVYQITKELNTFHFEGSGYRKKKVYDYPLLNGYLTSLRKQLKQYYLSVIKSDMFKYELIK